MISIKAKNEGEQTKLSIALEGTSEDIVTEAVHIMQQLPKRLQAVNRSLFFRFLAELMETDMFDVGMKLSTSKEDEDE